jgi:HD-like signal output (HDOD) protein
MALREHAEWGMRVVELKPGLVLAQEVRDVNGRLLMVRGMRLSDRSIGVLKAWGVAEVVIEGEPARALSDPGDPGVDISKDLIVKAQNIAAARLARSDLAHLFVQDVFRLAASRIAACLARGESVEPPAVRGASPDSGRLQVTSDAGRPVLAAETLEPLDMDRLAAGDLALGAKPEVLSLLAQAMENPSASALEVADIIQNDPGLTAKLLKMVNSALYGFPQRIDTISRAVTVIGVQQLSALALGVTVMDMFKDIPGNLLDVGRFWRHCLACACGSRVLASALGLPNTERFFVAGLLHDVGLLLLILHAPAHVRQVLASMRENGEEFIAAERAILGADHAMVGGALLSGWKLPPSLVAAVEWHHAPLAAANPRDAAIVHTADFLAEALMFGSCGQSVIMPLELAAFDQLMAPAGVAATVFTRVEDQLGQLETIFTPHAAD